MLPVFIDRPKFTALPLPGTGVAVQGNTIIGYNPRRTGLLLFNNGTGNVYLSRNQYMTNNGTILPPGAALNFLQAQAPVNALFALGDAGHDLRVTETVLMTADTVQPGA